MSDAGDAWQRRLQAAVDLGVRIAAGDLEARLPASDAGDELDALITALNALAEELGAERRNRERAEELLADEVETYEHAPALFCSLDAQSLLIDKCNQTLADALGRSKAQIVGHSVLTLCDEACRADVERALGAVATNEPPLPSELVLRPASGEPLVVATSATRVAGAQGRDRVRIVWRDVTHERRLEEQLAEAQKMEAIGRLSGGVAHDFNNILSVITGAATFIEEELLDHQLGTEDITLIQAAAARGSALTNDLLAFSRRRVVKPVATDVRLVVENTERMARRLVGEHIRIQTELEPGPLVALIDPSQLSQVLLNLVINARDAMPSGGSLRLGVSRVETSALEARQRLDRIAGAAVRVAVTDTGTGMSEEVMSQAFEPFFTTKAHGKGSGLGLSTCYGIVRQAGGRIGIETELGRGTSVSFYLPLCQDPPHPELRLAPGLGGSETILLVEDDSGVRAVTTRILENGGYRVLAAPDGPRALELAASSKELALVVTDVMMPEMRGWELAAALRRARPTLRVLFISGYAETNAESRALGDPNSDFLAKPFLPADLLSAVRGLLDR